MGYIQGARYSTMIIKSFIQIINWKLHLTIQNEYIIISKSIYLLLLLKPLSCEKTSMYKRNMLLQVFLQFCSFWTVGTLKHGLLAAF